MRIELTKDAIKMFVANCKCKDNLLEALTIGIFTNNDNYGNLEVPSDRLFEVLNYTPAKFSAANSSFYKKLYDDDYKYVREFITERNYYYKGDTPLKANPVIVGITEYNFVCNYAVVTIDYNPGKFYSNEECTENGVNYKDGVHPYYRVDTEQTIREITLIKFD